MIKKISNLTIFHLFIATLVCRRCSNLGGTFFYLLNLLIIIFNCLFSFVFLIPFSDNHVISLASKLNGTLDLRICKLFGTFSFLNLKKISIFLKWKHSIPESANYLEFLALKKRFQTESLTFFLKCIKSLV